MGGVGRERCGGFIASDVRKELYRVRRREFFCLSGRKKGVCFGYEEGCAAYSTSIFGVTTVCVSYEAF